MEHTMTPAQKLASEIVTGFSETMDTIGVPYDSNAMLCLEDRIARKIQQLADEQDEQSDAQAFGDDLEVAVQGIEHCDCYSCGADLIVNAHPLFPEPTGLN